MKVTLRDIAEKVNVSISTVSRVLNDGSHGVEDATHLRILKVAEDLGYRRTKKTEQYRKKISEKQIGLIINKMKDKYHDPYFSELIYGLERELLDQGYSLGFTYDAEDLINMSIMDEIQGNDYGIICIATSTELLDQLSKKVQYIISVGGTPELDIDYVTINFEKGAKESVNHLLRLGHRKVAYIGSSSFQSSVSLEQEGRFLGYKHALEKQGIALHQEWIADGQFTIGGGYEAMKQILMAKDRPTALFTASDQMALGAYRAIQEAGLSIPGDMAVASFDDIEMSQFMHPPLTTVKVDKEELGRIAVKLFIQRMEGTLPLPMASYLPTKLIVRESCGFASK